MKKKVLHCDQVKKIIVPNLPDFTARNLNVLAKDDPEISSYLPEYSEVRPFNRNFLFTIIHSVKPDFFPHNIKELLFRRKEKLAEKNHSELEIGKGFLDLIMGSSSIPKK